MLILPLLFASALAAAPADPADPADPDSIDCDSCEQWNRERAPFQLFGPSYYVGTEGLSSVLIATPQGLILIDGDLPQSAPAIVRNIRRLGYRPEDLRWIAVSHAHFDHVGGVAALQRLSGAKVVASPGNAAGLRAGAALADDPQAGYGAAMGFPAVADVTEIGDGESITLGNIRLTAHFTPGHTPGGTSWSWRSCEKDQCRDLVYADSLTAVSAPGFRYSDDPRRVAAFERSIASVRALPCDLLVTAHPGFSGLFEKQQARSGDTATDPMLAPGACREYADDAEAGLRKRLASESAQGEG